MLIPKLGSAYLTTSGLVFFGSTSSIRFGKNKRKTKIKAKQIVTVCEKMSHNFWCACLFIVLEYLAVV